MGVLIKPKEITLEDMDGESHTYLISRFDCITGREIMAKYVMSNLPKIGDYDISNEMMLKLMSYVAVKTETDLGYQTLSTKAMVINHVPDFDLLTAIEKEMVEYNTRFFQNGKISGFFEAIAQMFLSKISAMLTQ